MPPEPENKSPLERWLIPALIIAFCVAAFYVSTTFKKMPPILKRGIQPSDFPQLLLLSLIALTLLMAWLDPVRVRDRLQQPTLVALGLMAVFAALTFIDFFLALAVFAAALAFSWGERRVWALGLMGIAAPLCIFFLFDQIFEVRFPRGLLTNLWYG